MSADTLPFVKVDLKLVTVSLYFPLYFCREYVFFEVRMRKLVKIVANNHKLFSASLCLAIRTISWQKKWKISPFSILLTFQMCNKKRNKIIWNDSISPWNSSCVSNIFHHFVTKQKLLEKNVFWTNLKINKSSKKNYEKQLVNFMSILTTRRV